MGAKAHATDIATNPPNKINEIDSNVLDVGTKTHATDKAKVPPTK